MYKFNRYVVNKIDKYIYNNNNNNLNIYYANMRDGGY